MDVTQIDTRIGTNSSFKFSNGNTLPLTGKPFGMNYLSVQTSEEENSWWFNPYDHTFKGFRLTHQPSPWIGDFQHLCFSFKTRNLDNYEQIDDYNIKKAIFRPDLMRIDVSSQEIIIQATADNNGGAFTFSNYSNKELYLVISGPKIKLLNKNTDNFIFEINNFSECNDPNFKMWLALKNNKLNLIKNNYSSENDSYLIALDEHSELIFATSFISSKQAEYNLSQKDNFASIHQNTINSWNKYLQRIQIEDADHNKVKTFYENLYRCFLYPMQFYEVTPTGKNVHYDTTSKKVVEGKMFTNVGFWDVYRTSFPLYSLICPSKLAEFLEGFYNSYLDTKLLPRWLSPDERGMMPGSLLNVIVTDAAVKNIISKDLQEKYLKAMVEEAEDTVNDSKYKRDGLKEYIELGYVPLSYHESVNKTLDYSYSDWAIYQLAILLNKNDIANKFSKRIMNFKNLFNQKNGLMCPKDADGNFKKDFNDLDWGNGFTEGSAWQNSFNVFQDCYSLTKLYGSKEKLIHKLTELANKSPLYNVGSYGQVIHEMREMIAQPFGQIAISNQPSFHLPYLFALLGKPHYTEILVRQILSSFDSSENGFPGDEDNGSLSAWYIWSSLGLYPEAAGKGSYIFGIPSFDFVKIKLENGKALNLSAYQNDPTHQFVSKRLFNNIPSHQTISHSELMIGGHIDITLSLLPE